MANKTAPADHPMERGWGMMLPEFFNSKIKVDNRAVNGRSSKNFLTEGRWAKVYEQIKPGDYVFIQFGHNDEKTDTLLHTDPETSFKTNLTRYVCETRERGGIPVLFTSIVRRTFNPDGTLRDTHGRYIGAVREVANQLQVICIDLNTATQKLILSMGDEPSKALYMWTAPTAINPTIEIRKDNTHLNIEGARTVAQLAVDSLRLKIPALKRYILD
jgi:pectinesterase